MGIVFFLGISVVLIPIIYIKFSNKRKLCDEGLVAIGRTIGEVDRSGLHKIVYQYEVGSDIFFGTRTVDFNIKALNGYYVVVYHKLNPRLSYILFEYPVSSFIDSFGSKPNIDCTYINGGDISLPTEGEIKQLYSSRKPD